MVGSESGTYFVPLLFMTLFKENKFLPNLKNKREKEIWSVIFCHKSSNQEKYVQNLYQAGMQIIKLSEANINSSMFLELLDNS